MNKIVSYNLFFKDSFLTVIGVLLCLYFSYHAISGERSVFKLMALNAQIEENVAYHNNVVLKRQNTQQNVTSMRPGSIDSDLLEAQVRGVLGYIGPDEMVVLSN